jgi:chromosome segregation ATPase
MKTLVTVILILACIGLVVALVVTQKRIDEQRQEADNRILDYSNQVVAANDELNDLRQVNLALTNDLSASREQLTDLSNQVISISNTLSNRDTQLKSAQDQIASLVAQNQSLDQQEAQLTNTEAALEIKIAAAEAELAQERTNNTFLEGQLTNQMAINANLTQNINDLKFLRTQARKVHDELVVQRRLEWIREGTMPGQNNVKGAQLLMARSWPTNKLAPPAHYNLSVEVDSSGAVHIVSDTNSAANPGQ